MSVAKTILNSGIQRKALNALISRSTSSVRESKIGFVGLGNMGLPMCLNLVRGNKEVLAFDLNEQSLREAEIGGAHPVETLEELAEGCSLVVTMLPGCQAVDAVMPTLLKSMPHPSVFIDCSTVSPSTSRRLNEEAEKHGHALMDAPVSGGVKGAQDATLTFMAGATEDSKAFQSAKPVLELMGQRVISCGGIGTGAATKLCNNLALAAQMIGICEAMNLGEELGVDPNTLANVMNMSTAKCWSSQVNNPHPDVADGTPASNDYEGGFGTKLMLKDLGLAVAAAEENGVALPLGVTSKELYRLANMRGLGEKDFGIILQFLRGR